MTLAEYKDACSAETIATAFMDKSTLQTLDPVLWTDLLLSQLEAVIPVVRGDLEVSGSDEIGHVVDLNALVLKRSNAIVYMHGDEWALRLKAMTALAGFSASDLGDTWSRARTASGRKDGGTTTDGTAKRNSFNTSELVPVSGSHVEAPPEKCIPTRSRRQGRRAAARKKPSRTSCAESNGRTWSKTSRTLSCP